MKVSLFRYAVAAATLATFSGVAQAQNNILLIEDQGGFGNAANVLIADGHTVTVINNEFANNYVNLLNGGFLNQFDFVVYGERGFSVGSQLPQAVADSLENYIQGGGDLLVTGYDTLGSPGDAALAGLVRSTTFSDLVSNNSDWQTADIDNFILNGAFGDFRNLTFTATGYDDDVLTPDAVRGAVALATTPGEPTARIIFTQLAGMDGGSVGYWNGGLPGTDTNAQPDFSDGANPQNIFRNWAAGVNGSAVAVPETGTFALAGLALPALGVIVARRRKKSA